MDFIAYIKDQLQKQPQLLWEIHSGDWSTDFLRFYRSQTNYNISKANQSLYLSLYKDKRSYGFTIHNPTQAKIDAALKEALDILDKLPPDPDFVDLEDDLTLAEPREVTNNIEQVPLELKTAILNRIAAAVKPYGFEIFGTFICCYGTYRTLNSNRLDKSSTGSPIFLEVKAVHKDSEVTVLENFGGEDFARFDEEEFTAGLLRKIEHCKNPVVDVEAGEYDVILAPRCVAEFVQYLSWSMDARAYDQHDSYFEDKLDVQVFPPHISITDDPTDPDMIRQDYGSDGHIYKPLKLVKNGVFKAFMCDHYYHHKTGLPKNGNTGNCLSIAPGESSLQEMIKSVKNGLYISSLHYMNFINMKETSITGLTRDGTFLIKDGKIVNVVNSLRFTEKIERILKNAVALENKAHTTAFSDNYGNFDISSTKAPHALIKGFQISSSTHTI
jgi:predicted Zn-dependent protease